MLSLFLLALAQKTEGPELTSGRAIPPEEACYDVWQYWVKVRVDPGTRRIDGQVEITAEVVQTSEELALDLDSKLTVSSVVMRDPGLCDVGGDKPVEFTQRDGEIRIHAP